MGRIAGIVGLGSVFAFFVGLANFGGYIQIGGAQGIIMPGWQAVLLSPIVLVICMFVAGASARREARWEEAQRQRMIRQLQAQQAKKKDAA